jgi:hypothetical protein
MSAAFLYLISRCLALRNLLEQQHQMPPVVGVRGGPAGGLAQEVARDDGVRVSSAYAQRRLRRYTAGPHVADAAADAARTELALILLGVHARVAGFNILSLSLDQHLQRGFVPDPLARLF